MRRTRARAFGLPDDARRFDAGHGGASTRASAVMVVRAETISALELSSFIIVFKNSPVTKNCLYII